jgi:hypothetical protein
LAQRRRYAARREGHGDCGRPDAAGLDGEAQDYRGRVQSTVLDPSKAALPGTAVTLRNDQTGVTATFVADALGRFIFDFVEPGGYTEAYGRGGAGDSDRRAVRVLTGNCVEGAE